MEKTTNQSFGITTYAWQEVSEKLIDLWKIEQMLNDSIFLKKYGQEVNHVSFSYIATPQSNFTDEEGITFHPETKKIKIILRLNYNVLINATSEEAFIMMTELYLTAMQSLKAFNFSNFNIKSLIHDIEDIFNQKGWLSKQAA
jgi:hypothetical protein